MRNYTDGMTLEEQVGQVLMVGFWGNTPSREIIELVQHYHIGNIILFSRNVRASQQLLDLTQSLQKIAKEAGQRHPLLIAVDQENGIVQRLGEAATNFPGNMALGATGSEEVARKVALATGRELKALGINMNLAPVVDVNNNPANPVIGVRSFGEDPRLVARLGTAMVRGYREAGIFSCLKHFPGHGDTAIDSHLALFTIPHSLERLKALELLPFRSGIAAGAESVMLAHIAFPALPGQDMLPATLSPTIVQGLLREQLGFNGVILTDCMEMRAISETFGTERATVMALQAGVDLVLVSHHYALQRGSFEAIRAAVRQGVLPLHTLQQAAERVLRHKARALSWNVQLGRARTSHRPYSGRASSGAPSWNSTNGGKPSPWGDSHAQLQDQAYKLSTTLVRNDDALVPLHLESGERIVVISLQRNSVTMVEDRYYSDDVLADIIRQYHPPLRMISIAPDAVEDDCSSLLQTTDVSDILIVVTVNAHLDERQAKLVRYLVSSGRRIIGIAARNPYDLLAFPRLPTYLVTYEYTRPALLAAVRVLFGERQALGHLPVSIPGLYP